MQDVIRTMSLLVGSQMIRKNMSTNFDIHYINEPVKHIYDKDKEYFLYMHIPFCHDFCTFCTFHKYKYDAFTCKEYFKNLRVELHKVKEEGFSFKTLYIGGGTPLIDEEELLKTIELAKSLFNITSVSCESTPNHIELKTLQKFKGYIDRLSVGVQTFDDALLKQISRYDKYGCAKVLEERLSAIIGILPVVSLDLIFNLKNQSEKMLRKDLQIAKKIGSEQITMYPLMKSHLTHQSIMQNYHTLKESKEYQLYNVIRDELKDYTLNNAWSFSRTKSNLTDEYTVSNSEYIGVGSGAFSHINNRLYVNAYDLNRYQNLVSKNTNAIDAVSEVFSDKKHIQYQFLLHLFGGAFKIDEFDKLFDTSLVHKLKMELFSLEKIKAISIENGTIYPTKLGEFISMILMKEFYMGMDNVRAMLRKSIQCNEVNIKKEYA